MNLGFIHPSTSILSISIVQLLVSVFQRSARMCPVVFTRGKLKGKKPTSSNEHRLSPLRPERSSYTSPPLMPGEANASQSQAPTDLPAHPDYLVHGNIQTTSGEPSNHQSEPITANVLPLPSDVPLPENLQDQNSPLYQERFGPNNIPATTGPVEGPDWWYCHVCRNGPQGIQTPGCTGMTAGGICGHPRCNLCATE